MISPSMNKTCVCYKDEERKIQDKKLKKGNNCTKLTSNPDNFYHYKMGYWTLV